MIHVGVDLARLPHSRGCVTAVPRPALLPNPMLAYIWPYYRDFPLAEHLKVYSRP